MNAATGVVTPAPDLRSPWWLDSQVDEENRLQWLSLPACDHSAGGLAVSMDGPRDARASSAIRQCSVAAIYSVFDATPLLTLMRYADWRPIILAGLGAR